MKTCLVGLLCLALPCSLAAQKKGKNPLSGYDRSARATVTHDTVVYVAPDETAQKLTEVLPGHELVVIERSGPWVKVFANTDEPDKVDDSSVPWFGEDGQPTPESGWIKDKGIVTPGMAGGDAVLFGLAADKEDEASRPHAPKDDASEARLLYRRVSDYFPESALAGDAAWRSADIRWQLEKADNSTLPSAKEQEAYLRPQIYDGDLKQVIKRYPGSKFAMLAVYDLLDNKLCGDWQGLPKCPEMEAGMYLKYASQFPESPKAPEAYYNAISREGVLVTMFQVDGNRKRAEDAAKRTQEMTADMVSRFPASDFTRRAQSIAFRVQQNISVYGTDRE